MLTPSYIEARIEEIRQKPTITRSLYVRILYESVLKEIAAGGCIDPRSLAIAVLKASTLEEKKTS